MYLAPSAKLSSAKCSLADWVLCTWESSCSVLIGEPLTKHLIPAVSYANSFPRIDNAVSLRFEISEVQIIFEVLSGHLKWVIYKQKWGLWLFFSDPTKAYFGDLLPTLYHQIQCLLNGCPFCFVISARMMNSPSHIYERPQALCWEIAVTRK